MIEEEETNENSNEEKVMGGRKPKKTIIQQRDEKIMIRRRERRKRRGYSAAGDIGCGCGGVIWKEVNTVSLTTDSHSQQSSLSAAVIVDGDLFEFRSKQQNSTQMKKK
jgi:hypothetical protein